VCPSVGSFHVCLTYKDSLLWEMYSTTNNEVDQPKMHAGRKSLITRAFTYNPLGPLRDRSWASLDFSTSRPVSSIDTWSTMSNGVREHRFNLFKAAVGSGRDKPLFTSSCTMSRTLLICAFADLWFPRCKCHSLSSRLLISNIYFKGKALPPDSIGRMCGQNS
jgi:hypothetical protein